MLGPKILSEQVITPALERIAGGPGRMVVRTGWAEGSDGSDLPTADLTIVIDRTAAPLALRESVIVGREVHVIGDAAEPGNLWAAIRTGNAVGRAI